MNELKTQIVKIVEETCSDITIENNDFDTELKEIGVDSLDYASIFLALEEKYEIEIPDEKTDELNTINKMANWLAIKIG